MREKCMNTEKKMYLWGFMILFIALVWGGSVRSLAASKPFFPEKLTYMTGTGRHGYQIGDNKNIKVSGLKSSNKAVVTVSQSKEGGNAIVIWFEPKKAGTSKISFSAKTGGKTYKYKTTIKVIPYSKPVSSLKLAGKDYTSKITKTNSAFGLSKKTTGALSVKPAGGWKFESISTYNPKNGGSYKEYKKIPSKITVSKNCQLQVNMRNTKYDFTQSIIFFVN